MSEPRHPAVGRYLATFDSLARAVPSRRRRALRAEIESHLADLIPSTSSDSDAALIVLEFGTPAEIVEQELEGRHPRTRRRTVPAVVAAAGTTVLLIIAAVVISSLTGPPAPASVVTAHPEGPARITTGRAYSEYRAAIEAMTDPLPAGAEWPTGVPGSLDVGATPDGGVLESRLGTITAHFTWLCAWEGEYLSAERTADTDRLTTALSMLTTWGEQDFFREWDPDGSWAAAVIDPLRFDDSAGLRADFPKTCGQASITGVVRTLTS